MSSIWKELENVNLVLINVCFDKDDLENYGYYIRVDVQFFMGKLIVIVVVQFLIINLQRFNRVKLKLYKIIEVDIYIINRVYFKKMKYKSSIKFLC